MPSTYDPGMPGPLDRLMWQDVIFAPRPRRAELSGLVPTWPCRTVRVHVVRNEPFELVATVLAPFLAYAGLEAQITYGPDDDSLSAPASGLPDGCDAVVVWLDMERYGDDLGPAQLAEWVAGRVCALRPHTQAPVLVANWGSAPGGPAPTTPPWPSGSACSAASTTATRPHWRSSSGPTTSTHAWRRSAGPE